MAVLNLNFQKSLMVQGGLMEYLPALYSAVNKCKTYFIDEIEKKYPPIID